METNDKSIRDTPFDSDAEFLDAEFSWIRQHVATMELEKQLDEIAIDLPSIKQQTVVGKMELVAGLELNRRLHESRQETREFRNELDSRIKLHRQNGSFKLGIDIVCERHELTDAERSILLILTMPAVSPSLAMSAYQALGVFSSSMQIHDVITLLRPNGVHDWLQFRRLFQVSSPMIRHNLVTVDFRRKHSVPGDLWFADTSITARALATITSDPVFLDDCDPVDDPADIH